MAKAGLQHLLQATPCLQTLPVMQSSFKIPLVGLAALLVKPHLDELKFEELLHLVITHNPEQGCDDVSGGVAQVAEVLHDAIGAVQLG